MNVANIGYKRVASRVSANTIVEIKELPLYSDATVQEYLDNPIKQCWLYLIDGSRIRCHRKRGCKCPKIGDFCVKFYEEENAWHMSKEVFEKKFVKLNIIDKVVDYIKKMVKRG
jgi:hypothetical protein